MGIAPLLDKFLSQREALGGKRRPVGPVTAESIGLVHETGYGDPHRSSFQAFLIDLSSSAANSYGSGRVSRTYTRVHTPRITHKPLSSKKLSFISAPCLTTS